MDTSSAPTHHASLAGGMSSSSSSSNGMMRSASSSAKGIQRKGEGVRIENVVTHKRQFKIHSGSKTYFLKTTADTNDQNGKVSFPFSPSLSFFLLPSSFFFLIE